MKNAILYAAGMILLFSAIALTFVYPAQGSENMAKPDWWLVMPDEVEKKILEWEKAFPELVECDHLPQYVGLEVYTITLTDKSVPNDKKRGMILTVPHGNEPAGTAGAMDYICELLEGRHLDGTPSDITDRDHILKSAVLTFIPNGNPDGRARSPVPYWDGCIYNGDEYFKFTFGIDSKTNGMFKRVPSWSLNEEKPAQIGIIYEQLDEDTYIEPNTNPKSVMFRLMDRAQEKYTYNRFLDLHQYMDASAVWLPSAYHLLSKAQRDRIIKWREVIVEAWKETGANITTNLIIPYDGEQRQQFLLECYEEFEKRVDTLTLEVQNNRPETQPRTQLLLTEVGIRASVEDMLNEGN